MTTSRSSGPSRASVLPTHGIHLDVEVLDHEPILRIDGGIVGRMPGSIGRHIMCETRSTLPK
jgi:hypothetical protein